ncbi:metallophosphoesterase [Leifsonia sp. F6_8S_P_1B]|uniref:Metallophosphoesterase n=1 Tax=Leifsonia williamsii TaxID=3035919 RepID=A0ABT8KEP7_9MICO|nr:metallophosphoesterase [Leifsonia williamsii]MDN4615935.1 metallophosphoesterase [Leifsonia williamsii]
MASPSRRQSSLSSRVRRTVAAATLGALGLTAAVAATAVPASAAPAPAAGDLGSRFTLAVLPDTQFYSRYSADQFTPRYGTDPFAVQTDWLTKNADALQIPFVTHLGDVVDQVHRDVEWQAADRAIQTLDDAKLPYSILAGNHDVRNSNDNLYDDQYNLANEPFLKWFGAGRAAGVSTFEGSDPTGFNQFHIFEADGQQYLVLALSWRASDATLAWANQVLKDHPTLPAILTTHQVINIAADGETPLETDYGLRLWDKLIRSNDQIFLTLNGHFHGASRLTKTNDFGHAVTEVVIDYQMAYEGGDGYLGLYEFDLTNDRINVQTASPWVKFKPQDALTRYDQLFQEGPQQQFSIPIDFSERFKGFAPDFAAGPADTPSLAQKARSILEDGFTGPDPISTEFPGATADFPEVDGTLAHWRFNGVKGTVGTETVIEDVAGDNDLHRADPAATNSVGTTLEDVTVASGDVHGYSSDGSAACFANSSGSRYSYLTTAADAPVNDADLSKGFTIETFVKMDASWDAAANGWSKFLVHTGNRSRIDGFAQTPWDYTASPTALGISNLREFQWTGVPQDPTKGDRTAWSGEIMPGAWSHVAIVGEEDGTLTMYVDGAPVLRNTSDALGLAANPHMPWIIGADWVDDAARNGWNGCVGETRIIDHATGPDEWLTARADLTGLTLTGAPTGQLPAGSTVAALSGTGLPGATVTVRPAGAAAAAVAATDVDAARAAVAVAETTALAADASATAVVGDDGKWTARFAQPLTAGSYDLAVAQSLGTRSADPARVTFSIAAAPGEVPPGETPPGQTPPGQTPPGGEVPGGQVPGGDAPGGDESGTDDPATADPAASAQDELASTGSDLVLPAILALLALVAGGAGVILARRRRSA